MKIKDFLLYKEGKQFVFIGTGKSSVRILSDGEIFTTLGQYLHVLSKENYTVLLQIDKFDANQIHLDYTIKLDSGQFSRYCRIDDLTKTSSPEGIRVYPAPREKPRRRYRRKV